MYITGPVSPDPDGITRDRENPVNNFTRGNVIAAVGFAGKFLLAGNRRKECF